MPTVLETVKFTVTGPNGSQTKSVQVAIDQTTGAGSASFVLTGTVGGADSIVASMASLNGTNYSSNVADVNWQPINGPVAVGPVTLNVFAPNGPDAKIYTGNLSSHLEGPYTGNSLVIDEVVNGFPITGFVSSDGNSGAYKHVPTIWQQQNSAGAFTSNITINNKSAQINIRGYFVIPAAGTYTFLTYCDDSWVCWLGKSLGGAIPTRVGGSYSQGGSASPQMASAIFMGQRLTEAQTFQNLECWSANFPQPGVYPFEYGFGNTSDQTYFEVTYSKNAISSFNSISSFGYGITYGGSGGGYSFFNAGVNIPPVASIFLTPPNSSAPGANLALSPSGGISNQLIQGQQITLTLNISGVHYNTKPYIPLLEGHVGKVNIYNDPTNPTFTFPTYNGQAVDKTAAAAAIFSLSGDNNSWQGRLASQFDGTNFNLNYNGSAFDSHVGTTQLTIAADDIAWYQSTGKTFDLFKYTTQGGGKAVTIEIDYLVSPTIASVTPTSIPADGGSHVITFNLTRPLPPLQNQTSFGVTFSGQQPSSIGAVALVTDGQGWVTGFNLTVTAPLLSSSASATPNVTAQGIITYLNGTSFVTGNVVYLNSVAAQGITWTAFSAPAPTHYAWLANPAPVSGTDSHLSPTALTLTATFYSRANNIASAQFYKQNKTTSVRTAIGAVINPTNKRTATIGGSTAYLADFVLTTTFAAVDASPGDLLGYIGKDSDNQTVTFFDTATYINLGSGGGGGGGGGCPALEMFVDEWHRVSDVFVGMGVETLVGEYQNYPLNDAVETEPRNVKAFDFSTEFCYQLTAENGAEIVISASTPVPTRESIERLKAGEDPLIVPQLVCQIKTGMHVVTEVDDQVSWSKLTEVFPVGMRRVAKIDCGGRNFAAGSKPGKYIYTHNLQIVK